MVGLRQILTRFRPLGAPGPAASAAVPADRRTELLDEVAPVFADLAETRAQAAELVRVARAEAEALRTDGARRAARLVEDASTDRAAIRAEAHAKGRSLTEASVAARIVAGRQEADRIDRIAAARVPVLADRVLGAAQAELTVDDRSVVL